MNNKPIVVEDNSRAPALASVSSYPPSPSTPSASSAPPRETELVVFGSIPYWDQERALAVFKNHVQVFDVISLFWYRLNSDGSIGKYNDAREDLSIIDYAHENGVQVLALVANLPEDDDWDADRVHSAIGTSEVRSAHVSAILELVEEKGFDGINIDYEFLRDRQAEDFALFIEDLAAALHARGKILAIAIHAQTAGGPSRGQDMQALQSADILALMTYDEHWETSHPGPVASLPWVRDVLEHAESLGVSEQKIFLGMPLYGYDWVEGRKAMGREYEDVVGILETEGAEASFDFISASPFITYRDPRGRIRELWYEDERSFIAKLELAREFNLGGIHLWRLGREDGRIYDSLGW